MGDAGTTNTPCLSSSREKQDNPRSQTLHRKAISKYIRVLSRSLSFCWPRNMHHMNSQPIFKAILDLLTHVPVAFFSLVIAIIDLSWPLNIPKTRFLEKNSQLLHFLAVKITGWLHLKIFFYQVLAFHRKRFNNRHRTKAKRNTGCNKRVSGQDTSGSSSVPRLNHWLPFYCLHMSVFRRSWSWFHFRKRSLSHVSSVTQKSTNNSSQQSKYKSSTNHVCSSLYIETAWTGLVMCFISESQK